MGVGRTLWSAVDAHVGLLGNRYCLEVREDSSHPGTCNLAGRNLLGFAEGNLWNDFKPDIKHIPPPRLILSNRTATVRESVLGWYVKL
jgi:hypothetical protein